MTPAAYCQDKAARSGSSFYYSFLFLSPEQRRAITALYAFCREVDDVVDECSDAGLARTKLHWWRQEVARVFEASPEHPVGKELREALHRYPLAREHFEDIIDGMEMDLDQSTYATFKDLSLYCHRVAGVVGLMAAEIFGYANRHTQKYAHSLGMAFQLTNILRDVREDAGRGRVYLPQDELERFQVSASALNGPNDTDLTRALFAHQAERARAYYARALSLLPDEDRYRQRTGLIMAAIYQSTLAEIEKDGYRILEHRVVLTPLRKLWIAWSTALREHRRRPTRRRAA
ncbi:MAG: presqualene diphosphate synthase HpnD [Gammaproteobacteria bacterium]|nr:presqualene diphosphate synthase HpnD [Gammaproteobacteria bacterium]MDJ0890885.1 presqualene diphosphate synthase HpnD [Gammaproteobacteria bacterium]